MLGNSIIFVLVNEFVEVEFGLYVVVLMELGLILFVIIFIVFVVLKFMIMCLVKNEGVC